MGAFKKDMLMLHITEEMTFNRTEWKKMIDVANLKKLGMKTFLLFCYLG